MAETFTWIDGGAERVLWMDPPSTPGARFLAVRRGASEEDWSAACVLAAGEPEREIGDGLVEAWVAEDVILKYAIQGLAQLHGVSPAPGIPDDDAGEAEVFIMRLWRLLTARWAPPEGSIVPPDPEADREG
jgi:hypothetical protein